jgi:hypothetical protein
MAFITDGETVTSFADFEDVLAMDQRLFEANEGLTDDIVVTFLTRSTERILSLIRSTDWWRDYYLSKTTNPFYTTNADVPLVDINRIKARQNDFTDLCVMYALWNYILPKVADFSKEDNAERAKIGFYQGKYQFLFDELINSGDWYDLDDSGTISSTEKQPGNYVLKRVR